MSGETSSEHPLFTDEFGDVPSRLSSFVHAISVVNRWMASGLESWRSPSRVSLEFCRFHWPVLNH
jgi:hypothetical protein